MYTNKHMVIWSTATSWLQWMQAWVYKSRN